MKHTAARHWLVIAAVTGFGLTVPAAHAESPTLGKIRSSNTLTLGYRESSIPFSFLGADQKPVGFSLDLCAAIAEKLKADLKMPRLNVPLSNLEWVDCRVKCGRKPGEANT